MTDQEKEAKMKELQDKMAKLAGEYGDISKEIAVLNNSLGVLIMIEVSNLGGGVSTSVQVIGVQKEQVEQPNDNPEARMSMVDKLLKESSARFVDKHVKKEEPHDNPSTEGHTDPA